MTLNPNAPDITVRGGLINIPNSAKPQPIPRHRPNTPPTKKRTIQKTDHQPYTPAPGAPTTEPKADPPPTQEPTPDDTDGDKNHVPTETSQSD